MELSALIKFWKDYPWTRKGVGWNEWGTYEEVYTRIMPMVAPESNGDVIEIAFGMGRTAKALMSVCRSYVGYDVVPYCAEVCANRFPSGSFHISDGLTLHKSKTGESDLVMSYDAMIMFDRPTMESYIKEALRVLRPGGVALFHHSNMEDPTAHLYERNLWRGTDITKEWVKEAVISHGGEIVSQELWSRNRITDTVGLFDCFTKFRRLN